jgi:hypothetical protein
MDMIMNSPQFSPSPSVHQQQIQVDKYDYTLQTQDESKSVPMRQAGPALCVDTTITHVSDSSKHKKSDRDDDSDHPANDTEDEKLLAKHSIAASSS